VKVFAALEPIHNSLPRSWQIVALRRVAVLREARNLDGQAQLLSLRSSGKLSARGEENQPPAFDYIPRYWLVSPGDLVVNPMWLPGGGIGVATTPGAVSPDYRVYRLGSRLDPRFVHYVLRSAPYFDQYRLLTRAETTFDRRVTKEDFRELPIPVPPVATQKAIADLLDVETARIDALIEKKQRMIALLDERRVNATADLVLRGTRDGGSRTARSLFFDSVPEGWHETQLRHLGCEVQTGPFGSQLHAADYVDDGWPVVNPASLVGGRIVAVPEMMISDSKREELSRHILKSGDIVFGRRGEMGRAALVTESEAGWLCGTGSLRLRLRSRNLTPGYLKLLLETPALRGYFQLSSVGSTMDNLNSGIVLGAPVVVPPPHEQRSIVESVAIQADRCVHLMNRASRQIELLIEHREALVSAAVTGDLDLEVAA
jgi:type I restriction enzyme S subunit